MLLAFASEAANAMVFICLLVLTGILAFYTLGYAGVCLLNVLEETAAGNEDLSWPDDAFIDKAARAMVFGLILAIILIPIGILAQILRGVPFLENTGLRLFVLMGPGLWLLLPVGLLSSLSSSARWLVFRPAIVMRMLRLFPATAALYLTSAVLAGTVGVAWYYTLFSEYGLFILPIAAVLSGWMWLVYARLLGRLAAIIGLLGPMSAGPDQPKPTPINRPRKRKALKTHDPWAVPDLPRELEQPRPVIAEGEVVEPYLLTGDDKPVHPDARHLAGKVHESKVDKAERLARKRRLAQQQKRAVQVSEGIGILYRGLSTFPLEGKTLGVFVILSFGFLVAGGAMLALITLAPG